MNKPLLTAAYAAARIGLVAILGVGSLAAQNATKTTTTTTTTSTTPATETQTLEKFEVTGSRIKRVDVETPAPVATFTAQDIEAKGYVNVGDFIQSLPFNSGSANSIYQTASFLRGAATTNLRGLGSQRFLTLVNGRRAVPYALTNSGGRSVFDFNSLPAAAIESVELLKDGASAIYGSDAITGVLNIKLKKNFVGLSTGLYYGNTLKDEGGDTGTKEISLVAGAESGKTKIMTAFDVKLGNSNFLSDYGVKNTDYTYMGTNKGLNNNSTSNYPANLTLTRAQAATAGIAFPNVAATVSSWTFLIPGGQTTTTPTLSKFAPSPADPANANAVLIPNENRYNFAPVTAIYPGYDYVSNFLSLEHAFSDNLKFFAEVTYSKNSTYYAFTPVVIGYSTEGLSLPAANPYNPFGQALTTLSARALFGAVRKFDTDSTAGNTLLGFRGSVGRWDWETAVSYGYNTVTSISRNAIRASTYQSALNGTLTGFTGLFLNPFGPSDAGLTKALFTSSTSSNKSEGLTYDASVSGKLFELPAGDVGIAAGFEARNDGLTTNPDTAAYIGSGGGQPLSGKRTVSSTYVEITAPIYRTREFGSAELQLAGRHEHYSDFGDTSKPKIGLKIRLPDTKWLNTIIRGSYSESFQAPALGLLYASQTTGFTGITQDPLRLQDPPSQLRVVTGGNPNLLPETAKVQYVGAVFETPKVKNLSISVDFFDFRINQVIVTPGSAFLLSTQGQAQFPNGVVRDSTLGNPGPILFLQSVPQNNPAAYQLYRGMDFGIKYAMRNTRFGDFNFTGDATELLKTGSVSGLTTAPFFNNVGYYYSPRWKASATTAWDYKDFGATLSADWTGHWFNDGYTAAGWGENPFTTMGLSVRYSGLWNSRISVGASNILNNQPPPNGRASSAGYDQNLYGAGALGRFLYIRVRKEF